MYLLQILVKLIVLIGLLTWAWYVTSYLIGLIGRFLKSKSIVDFSEKLKNSFGKTIAKIFFRRKN